MDLEQNLESLKKKIQSIPDPCRKTSTELAHDRRCPKNKINGDKIIVEPNNQTMGKEVIGLGYQKKASKSTNPK